MDFQTRKALNILITAKTDDAICIIYCACLCWRCRSFFKFKTGGFLEIVGNSHITPAQCRYPGLTVRFFPEPKLTVATWRPQYDSKAPFKSWWKIYLFSSWPSINIPCLRGNKVYCVLFSLRRCKGSVCSMKRPRNRDEQLLTLIYISSTYSWGILLKWKWTCRVHQTVAFSPHYHFEYASTFKYVWM